MSIKSDAFKILQETFDNTGKVPSVDHIAQFFNTTKKYAYEIRSEWKASRDNNQPKCGSIQNELGDSVPGDHIERDYKAESADILTKSLTIKTLDAAIKSAKVDLDTWEVERHVVNTWTTTMKVTAATISILKRNEVEFLVDDKYVSAPMEHSGTLVPLQVTNYQVKIWLKRRKPNLWEETVNGLIKSIPQMPAPMIRSAVSAMDTEVAAEIALYDAHFGKFAWHPETMMGHWDIDICTRAYLSGCEQGLAHAANYSPSVIYFVIGQDFMHVDNSNFTTPHGGHQLDADGRFPKIARKAMETMIQAVNMCRSVAPVKIMWVPGNHDIHSSFWLSLILEQAFRDDPRVTIDNSPAQRKSALWGNLLVGWWHDASGRKLPASINALAQWWPEEWGMSKYRELHIGHKHKKAQTKTLPIETVGGVLIRQIPSLSSIDYWHQENLFVDAVPASQTFLWSKSDGIFADFTINVKPQVD